MTFALTFAAAVVVVGLVIAACCVASLALDRREVDRLHESVRDSTAAYKDLQAQLNECRESSRHLPYGNHWEAKR